MATTIQTSPPNNTVGKRAYGDITAAEIIDTALTIIQSKGVSALTMRGLADTLGMSPMAPYRYIQSKKALLDRIIDRVVGPIRVPNNSTLAWDQELRILIRKVRQEMTRYPGLARAMQERPPTKEQKRLAQQTMALVRSAGLDTTTSTHVAHVLLDYLYGSLNRHPPGRRIPGTGEDEFEFDFGLDLLLDGLKLRLATAVTP